MHMHNGRANTLTQMEELIVQNYNTPALLFGGCPTKLLPHRLSMRSCWKTTAP